MLATAGAKAAIEAAGGKVGGVSDDGAAAATQSPASVAGSASSPSSASACCSCVGALIVYRIGCFIPVPGVNPEAMLQLMETQKGTIVDMFNMFSGGALSASACSRST